MVDADQTFVQLLTFDPVGKTPQQLTAYINSCEEMELLITSDLGLLTIEILDYLTTGNHRHRATTLLSIKAVRLYRKLQTVRRLITSASRVLHT